MHRSDNVRNGPKSSHVLHQRPKFDGEADYSRDPRHVLYDLCQLRSKVGHKKGLELDTFKTHAPARSDYVLHPFI